MNSDAHPGAFNAVTGLFRFADEILRGETLPAPPRAIAFPRVPRSLW